MPASRKGSCAKCLSLVLAFLVCTTISVSGDDQGPGVRVEVDQARRLLLHVTLRSGATTTAEITRDQLPWEAGSSLVLLVATANGQCLKRNMFVSDPIFQKISVKADAPLHGDIDLERLFPDVRRLLQVSDVQLFWAYKAPEELRIGDWSGGWILITKQK